jgi:chaperonin GroEL
LAREIVWRRGRYPRGSSHTEAEMKAKKEALDDAISSTQAAVAEGIVPGGGLALLKCIEAVGREEDACRGDEKTESAF